jgi:hypothetical protein
MRGALLACGLAALAACHDLPALGTCGNGIVEAAYGEACDDGGPSATCTAACTLACTNSAAGGYVAVGTAPSGGTAYCPDASYHCGADTICRAPSGRFAPLAAALPFDIGGSPVLGDIDNDGLPDLVGTSATSISIRFGSTAGTPLGALVVQEAPSSDAPYAIFDLHPGETAPVQSNTMIAIPTEGVALLRSDGERFTPELDLNPINLPMVSSETLGIVVRDPDPTVGDVVIAVQSRSANPSIGVVRPPIGLPGIAMQLLPPCVGAASQGWRTVDVKAAPDRRSFVVVTQRDSTTQPAAQPWHVCRYTQAGAAWALVDFELTPPTPSSVVLANLDADACLELAVRSDGAPGLAMLDAAGAGCGFTPAVVPLPITVTTAALLGAGQIIPGGIDELVLTDGVYRACAGTDCGTSAAGTFTRVASPTQVPWHAAALVDLNGDGALDIVAARAGEADVDVVRGGAVPNVYRANTSEPVTSLVAGDFDGDRLGDVAMVEATPPGDRVTVLFGTKEAIVGTPLAMSPFGGRLRLDRLSEISWIPSTRGSDGIDDLLVLDTGTALTAGVLVGDAARLMTTPRFPTMTSTGGTPLGAVAAGSFGSDNVELLAITGTQAQHYDILANRWAPPIDLGMQLGQPVGALRDGPARTLGAARGAGERDVVVFSARSAVTTCQVTASGTPRELRGIDIDGDGVDELAVLSDVGAGPSTGPGIRTLQLFRTAGCPLAPLLVDALAGCVDVANAGGHLVAICRIGNVPVARGLFALDPGTGGELVRAPAPFALLDGDARFVTAGDYDGNGVLDIAVGVRHGSSVGVQLLQQCPAHDLRACR